MKGWKDSCCWLLLLLLLLLRCCCTHCYFYACRTLPPQPICPPSSSHHHHRTIITHDHQPSSMVEREVVGNIHACIARVSSFDLTRPRGLVGEQRECCMPVYNSTSPDTADPESKSEREGVLERCSYSNSCPYCIISRATISDYTTDDGGGGIDMVGEGARRGTVQSLRRERGAEWEGRCSFISRLVCIIDIHSQAISCSRLPLFIDYSSSPPSDHRLPPSIRQRIADLLYPCLV